MTANQFRHALNRLPVFEQEIRALAHAAHVEMKQALANVGDAAAMGYHEKRAEELLYELDLRLIKENDL